MTRIRILWTVITVRSFALSVVLMVSIGVAFVALYGQGVMDLASRVADALLPRSPTCPSSAEVPVTTQPKRTKEARSVSALRVGMGLPTYRSDADKLRGRVLPLRTAPDPSSEIKLRIPPGTTGIRPTGRTALYREPVWLFFFRPVLWREVEVAGERGWVSDHFLQPNVATQRGDGQPLE
jgi:hypothetical protein